MQDENNIQVNENSDETQDQEIFSEEIENSEDSEEFDPNKITSKGKKLSKEDEKKIKDQESKFVQGQMITFVKVRFPGNAKPHHFAVGRQEFEYGQKVLAMSDRGMTVGYVNSFPFQLPFDSTMLPIRYISKVATLEDFEKKNESTPEEKKAEDICQKYIEMYKLDMTLTHVEIIQFGKKAVFYFNAPERVDFRQLVKSLVTDLKMRIELRQISVRDRAAALGAIGACGRPTCCSTFLNNYGNVSIKMAKNQNITLLANKLNGVCGQMKCCMRYEDDVYTEKRSRLPKEGDFIIAANGDFGKVTKLHILPEHFEMITSDGKIRRYTIDQFTEGKKPAVDQKFPEQFEHVVNESKEIIGLAKVSIKYEDSNRQEELNEQIIKTSEASIIQPTNEKSNMSTQTSSELIDDEDDENEGDVPQEREQSAQGAHNSDGKPRYNKNKKRRFRNFNKNKRPPNK